MQTQNSKGYMGVISKIIGQYRSCGCMTAIIVVMLAVALISIIPRDQVIAVSYLGNTRDFMSVSEKGKIGIWCQNQLLRQYKTSLNMNDSILVMSPDRNIMAVAAPYEGIGLFDRNGIRHQNILTINEPIKGCVFSTDSQHICIFGDRTLCIYRISSCAKLFHFEQPNQILACSFCHNNTEIWAMVRKIGDRETRELRVWSLKKDAPSALDRASIPLYHSSLNDCFVAITTYGKEGFPLILSDEYVCWIDGTNVTSLDVGKPIKNILSHEIDSSCVVIETEGTSSEESEIYSWNFESHALQKCGDIKKRMEIDGIKYLPVHNVILYTTIFRRIFVFDLKNGCTHEISLTKSQQNHGFFHPFSVNSDETHMLYFYRNRTVDKFAGFWEIPIPRF